MKADIRLSVVAFCMMLVIVEQATAAQIRVATASNFKQTMSRIVELFEQDSPHTVVQINGSTGKHFAQIKNGAPYDLFFAANRTHPQALEDAGLGIKGTGYSYAFGRLVLWAPGESALDERSIVDGEGFMALANPRLAPYGRAAQQVLQKLGHWSKLQPRLVRGENVAQAFQYVVSGNARMGFVAKSQLSGSQFENRGAYWVVPAEHYDPIEQYAIMLSDNDAARSFLNFCKSDSVRQLIKSAGYDLPEPRSHP